MSESHELHEAKFSDYPFLDSIFQDIAAAGYERPTAIQVACLPPALEGRDLIGVAHTGTGKTAVFALPIINRLAHRLELAALILAPTRELAAQITVMFNQLGRSSGIRVATVVGGVPIGRDYKALKSWPNVLVATPGRLIDHIIGRTVHLHEIEVLVVDEGDRMHDMGFIPQIRRILVELPKKRQTMMFTATMSAEVERIARTSMHDAVRIQIGRTAPAKGARQQLLAVREEQKTPLLMDLLAASNGGRVLVFVRTKRGVDRLARVVTRRFRAARIHGDREQTERDEAMAGFRQGRYKILIATDIASRGLDVAGIEHVVNYDFPREAEDYVHRVGRTARQDAEGLATSFVTRGDRQALSAVKRLIGDRLPELTEVPCSSPGDAPTAAAEVRSPHDRGRAGHGPKASAGDGRRRRHRGDRGCRNRPGQTR